MDDLGARLREYVRLDQKRSAAGLSPDELQRWILLKRLLSQRFAPDISDAQADLRESVRVPARLRVSFGSLGAIRDCLMTNLSRGGLFIATDALLDIGARVTLRIHIEAAGTDLEIPAEVVCHNVNPRFQEEQGMGVRFGDLDPDTQKQVDELYERSLRRALSDRD